jgi:RimJ/RimL family protein N-acetyltransferase
LKSGQVFKEFKARNGKTVTLRVPKWEDLDNLTEYARALWEEAKTEPDFGVPFDPNWTPESEVRWLADVLVRVELGQEISIFAEIDGKLAGTCSVIRKSHPEFSHYGRLGISVAKEFRNSGIGSEMMKTLVNECRKSGLKLIDLEVFANNPMAIHVYEKAGFRQAGRTPNKRNRNGHFVDDILMVMEL